MKKHILIEILWIIGGGVLSIFLTGLFIGFNRLVNPTLEMQLHDTYFVLTPFFVGIPSFLLLNFLLLSIRVFLSKFQKVITNFSLIIITGLLIISLNSLAQELSRIEFLSGGWTVYPPSSAIINDPDTTTQDNIKVASNTISILIPLLVLVLIITCLLTGRNLKTKEAIHERK